MEPSPSSYSRQSCATDHAKIFLGGITKELEEEVLKEYFQKYGEVKEVVVMRERETGNVRGFGFIEFFDPGSAERSINEGHHLIRNRSVEVKRARPRLEERRNYQSHNYRFSDQGPHIDKRLARNSFNISNNDEIYTASRKIFVGGLPANITEVDFKSYFEKFGCVNDVVIMYDNATLRPRGFGFITFDTEEAVDNVMQKSFHELNKKLVEVKRAIPKDGSLNTYGTSYSGHSNFRASCGRMASNDYQPAMFTQYDPRYGYFYGYAPPYFSSYAPGPLGYGGGYAFTGYDGICYNSPYAIPRGAWSGQDAMAAKLVQASYPNAGFSSGFTNFGHGGYAGIAAGGHHRAVWPTNGKFHQFGTDLQTADFERKKSLENNVKIDESQ